MKSALFPAALGAALALGGASASAQPDEAQPIPSSVMDAQPVGDWPTPDNFARATGNEPLLQQCESEYCAAVLPPPGSEESYPGAANKYLEQLRIAATTGAEWPGRHDPFQLVAAVYENGVLVGSDTRSISFPGLVYEGDETSVEGSGWGMMPLSDTDWIEQVFTGGQAPFTAPADAPPAAADLEGADYSAGSDVADFGNPHETPGSGNILDSGEAPSSGLQPGLDRYGVLTGGTVIVGYPGSGERIMFEIDPAAFADGEAPQSLGDALIAELTFDPRESGRIGVLALAPRAVRGAQPVIDPDTDFQSFGLVLALEHGGR